MKADKAIKELYDALIYAIEANTEVEWQKENIMKALLAYLNAIK